MKARLPSRWGLESAIKGAPEKPRVRNTKKDYFTGGQAVLKGDCILMLKEKGDDKPPKSKNTSLIATVGGVSVSIDLPIQKRKRTKKEKKWANKEKTPGKWGGG